MKNKGSRKKLLFICGFPSGGTDLTKTIMNAHPEVEISGEIPFLIELDKTEYFSPVISSKSEAQQFCQWVKKKDVYNHIKNYDVIDSLSYPLSINDLFWSILLSSKKQFHGSKTPQFTENILTIEKIFPEACFIFVVRDVRDICLSWDKKWGKDMLLCSKKWAERMKKGYDAIETLPANKILLIKFEELLQNTEKSTREICRFLDVNFSSRMLEHHKHTKEIFSGKINYGNSIDKKNMNKWKVQLSYKTAKRIEEISMSTLILFDYKLSYGTEFKDITIFECIIGYIRDLIALIFTGNRSEKKQKNFKIRLKNIYIEIMKRI
jgi:hypothetical protein